MTSLMLGELNTRVLNTECEMVGTIRLGTGTRLVIASGHTSLDTTFVSSI
jgi:hypothetical protein